MSYLRRIESVKYQLKDTGDLEDYDDAMMLVRYIAALEELLECADDHDVFVGQGGWKKAAEIVASQLAQIAQNDG